MGKISEALLSEAIDDYGIMLIDRGTYFRQSIPPSIRDALQELQILRELAIQASCLIECPDNGMFEQQYLDAVAKWEAL